MRKLIFLTTLTMATGAWAQSSAQQGLDQLKTNVANSKANLGEYQKNLKIVESNVSEVSKARGQVQSQRAEVAKALEQNNQTLQQFEQNEKELKQLIADEGKNGQAEDLKIAELQKVIAQLQANKEKRAQNTTNYNTQLQALQKQKADWKARQEQITRTLTDVDSRLRVLTQMEAEWKGKQTGYQGEVKRWQQEADRNQKLYDNYSSLAEVKGETK